jgi:hypothetical protein
MGLVAVVYLVSETLVFQCHSSEDNRDQTKTTYQMHPCTSIGEIPGIHTCSLVYHYKVSLYKRLDPRKEIYLSEVEDRCYLDFDPILHISSCL